MVSQNRLFNSLGEMLQTDSWKEPIDYSKIESLISQQVESSRTYLKNALK